LPAGKNLLGLIHNLKVDTHAVFKPPGNPKAIFVTRSIARKVEISSLLCILEEIPEKRLDIKISFFAGEPETYIIAVNIKAALIDDAFVIWVVVTIVTYNQDKIFGQGLSEREMPVKFGAAMIIVMSYQLGKEDRVFGNKDNVSKPIIPSICQATEIIITGKCAGKLQLAEKLSMERDFLFSADRLFLKIGTVDKEYVRINWIRNKKTWKQQKGKNNNYAFSKIHSLPVLTALKVHIFCFLLLTVKIILEKMGTGYFFARKRTVSISCDQDLSSGTGFFPESCSHSLQDDRAGGEHQKK
jgi:hypothetical protein